MTREPWDDWVKTCGEPTVWCGFDWPEIISNYVVLPQTERTATSPLWGLSLREWHRPVGGGAREADPAMTERTAYKLERPKP